MVRYKRSGASHYITSQAADLSHFLILFFCSLIIMVAPTSAVYAQQVVIPDDQHVLEHAGKSEEAALEADKPFRLTVWNVHKFDNQQIRRDVKTLSLQSDFVLLQESMMGSANRNYFSQLFGLAWLSAMSFFTNTDEGTGVTTGSRIADNDENFVRSHAREPILGSPKMIVINKFPILGSDQELLVANIHGINFVMPIDYASQIEQLESAIKSHTGPMIVAGDFNTHMVQRILTLRDFAQHLNLNHVGMDNQKYNRLILDHIFTRGLIKKSARVRFDINSSDHYPLQAEFILSK